tara:strand:- start:160 stop:816 length:657 start_codon:yes stop_codon:yes gene_type:complete
MRFENKFNLESFKENQFLYYLKNEDFLEIYPKRRISSIYYDSIDYELFNLSEEGISLRKKIRARFYNSETKNLKIEYKNKIGELGNKEFLDISDFNKDQLIDLDISNHFGEQKIIRIPQNIDYCYLPVVLITYERRYFVQGDLKVRLTLDNSILFTNLDYEDEYLTISNSMEYPSIVVEVKYDYDIEPPVNFFRSISDPFNLILSRSSKYCNAIKYLK